MRNLSIGRAGSAAIVVCTFLCQGCTGWRSLVYDPAIAAAAQIGVDQRIRVEDVHGGRVDLRVTAIGVNYLEGRTIGDETIRMKLDQIREVEGRGKAPGKTGALVGGLVFMLGAMAVASGAYWIGP